MAIRGRRDRRCVRYGERPRERLRPGRALAVDGVLARRGHVVAIADGEGAVDRTVVGRSVVCASYLVVDVVAGQRREGVGRLAGLHAELAVADEVDPVCNLVEVCDGCVDATTAGRV